MSFVRLISRDPEALADSARFSVKGKKLCTRIMVGSRVTLAPGILTGCGCYAGTVILRSTCFVLDYRFH